MQDIFARIDVHILMKEQRQNKHYTHVSGRGRSHTHLLE